MANADAAMQETERIRAENEEQRIANEVDKEVADRLAAEEAKKFVDIPPPPADLVFGSLAAPEGHKEAYCPPLREGRKIKRKGEESAQVAVAPVVAPVPVESIPENVRQSLALQGNPVENMDHAMR